MATKELLEKLTSGFDVDTLTEYFSIVCGKFKAEQHIAVVVEVAYKPVISQIFGIEIIGLLRSAS